MSDIQYQRNWLGSSICFLAAKVADHWSSVRLTVTVREQEKMRQSIENKRETKPSELAVTVMFHDREHILGGNQSFRARENAAPSLPDSLAVVSCFVSGASPQLGPLTFAQLYPSRDRTRRRSLPHTEKFSAEEPIARSALAVLAACPNTRSTQAVATVITPMTEQRRCVAA